MDHLDVSDGEGLEGFDAVAFAEWKKHVDATKAAKKKIEALRQEIDKLANYANVSLGRAQGVGMLLIKSARERGVIKDEVEGVEELGELLEGDIEVGQGGTT